MTCRPLARSVDDGGDHIGGGLAGDEPVDDGPGDRRASTPRRARQNCRTAPELACATGTYEPASPETARRQPVTVRHAGDQRRERPASSCRDAQHHRSIRHQRPRRGNKKAAPAGSIHPRSYSSTARTSHCYSLREYIHAGHGFFGHRNRGGIRPRRRHRCDPRRRRRTGCRVRPGCRLGAGRRTRRPGSPSRSGDVTNAADVAAAVGHRDASWRPLRMAVNCAGIGTAGPGAVPQGRARPRCLQPGRSRST